MAERIVQQYPGAKQPIRFTDIQNSVKLSFSISNFPKTKVSTDSCTLIQSMMKRQHGCLVRLSGLVVTELFSQGSYSKKSFYRSNCDCNRGNIKCVRTSLIEIVKAKDELSKKSPCLFTPMCNSCKTEYTKDLATDQFVNFKVLKVQPFNCKKDHFMVYAEVDEDNDIKIGQLLEGVFYLDSITRFNHKNERFVGENTRILIAVTLQPNSTIEILSGKAQKSILFKARDKQTYFKINSTLSGDEYHSNLVNTCTKNLVAILKNVQNRLTPAYFDMCALLSLAWHLHSSSVQENPYLASSVPDLAKYTSKEILAMAVRGTSMNLLVFSVDSPTIENRLVELAKGMINIETLPSVVDEGSLTTWLLFNRTSMLVIPNFHRLKTVLRTILVRAVENRSILIDDGDSVQTDATFVFIEHSSMVVSDKRAPEYKSWSFISSFDIVLNAQENSENSVINLLHSYGGQSSQKQDYCIPSRSSFTDKESMIVSGNSRLNSLCQKFAAKSTDNDIAIKLGVEGETASKMCLGFLSIMKDEMTYSHKMALSLKKIAVASRLLRSLVLNEASLLARTLTMQAKGVFEVGVFDAVIGAVVCEATAMTMTPSASSVLKNAPFKFIEALNQSISHQSVQNERSRSTIEQGSLNFHQRFCLEDLAEEVRIMLFNSMQYYI